MATARCHLAVDVVDVERLAAAWDELDEAREAGREPDWGIVPDLTLEERVVVLSLAVDLATARLEGARAWELERGA